MRNKMFTLSITKECAYHNKKSSDSVLSAGVSLSLSLGRRKNNREAADDRSRIEGVVVFSPSVGE